MRGRRRYTDHCDICFHFVGDIRELCQTEPSLCGRFSDSAVQRNTGKDILMIVKGSFRWKLTLGLLAAVAIDTLLQLTWKTTVLETPANSSPWATFAFVFANPLFLGVIGLMTLQFFNWLFVLAQADLSYAKPISALSYASVPALSVLVLDEAVDLVEIAGLILVIAGVWFISQTKPFSQESSELP